MANLARTVLETMTNDLYKLKAQAFDELRYRDYLQDKLNKATSELNALGEKITDLEIRCQQKAVTADEFDAAKAAANEAALEATTKVTVEPEIVEPETKPEV